MADWQEQLEKATRLLEAGRPVTALTGAGISVDCGVPPFRGPGGLWERFPPDEYSTAEAFEQDPARSWTMLREVVGAGKGVEPGAAHRALARLEQLGILSGVVTQNVDGLHQAAGSEKVVELHGSAAMLSCVQCRGRIATRSVRLDSLPPRCYDCGGVLRPNVVLFNEQLPVGAFERAHQLADRGGALLVVGTACQVYPAAFLPALAKAGGASLLEVNLTETSLTSVADLSLEGRADDVLPALATRLGA